MHISITKKPTDNLNGFLKYTQIIPKKAGEGKQKTEETKRKQTNFMGSELGLDLG